MQAGRGITVVGFTERYKIGIIGIVILHKNALVLKAGDGDTVLVVLGKGCDAEAKGGSRSQLLSRGWSLAPVETLDRPFGGE